MPITNYEEVSLKATKLLKRAMREELNANWTQAIATYKLLISLTSLDNMPTDHIPSEQHRLMLYECYYHLGWAHYQIQEYQLALNNYTSAINVLSKGKVTPSVKCRSVDWLLVPVLCKRAFAHALLNKYTAAVRDVTTASEVDIENMDILCCEVLIHNTFTEYDKAMKLLVKGLLISKLHGASQMLRAALKAEGHPPRVPTSNPLDLERVTTLRHPGFIEYIERYLRTLIVPHTILSVDIRSSSTSTSTDGTKTINKSADVSMAQCDQAVANYDLSWKKHTLSTIHPFKCGALPALFERDPVKEEFVHSEKHRRRDQYSGSLRESSRNMKFLTQDQFVNLLEMNQSTKRLNDWNTKREEQRKIGETITISTLKAVNTEEVPRHYTKPWLGERLQSAPLPARQRQPIFYPSYS